MTRKQPYNGKEEGEEDEEAASSPPPSGRRRRRRRRTDSSFVIIVVVGMATDSSSLSSSTRSSARRRRRAVFPRLGRERFSSLCPGLTAVAQAARTSCMAASPGIACTKNSETLLARSACAVDNCFKSSSPVSAYKQ